MGTSFVRPAPPVVRLAEGIVMAEAWRLREHAAAELLARCGGLAWTVMFPTSQVAHLVAFDGQVLGRVYRPHLRWYHAVVHGGEVDLGSYRTLKGAARALARHAGHLA